MQNICLTKVNKNADDICLKQLNYRFITDFEYYLKNYKNSNK
ncbi:phage integrase SAM-like domain-containing protein [Polaribacter sp. Asnod1-A03]